MVLIYDLLFYKEPKEKPKGFLMSKKAKDKWNQELVSKIEDIYTNKDTDYRDFIKLLAMKMPRVKELEQKESSDEN